MTPPRLLIDPVMQWAVEPVHQGELRFLEGMADKWPPLPHPGDVLTLPFIVDPATGEPAQVEVTRIVELTDRVPNVLAIVVRPHPPH